MALVFAVIQQQSSSKRQTISAQSNLSGRKGAD